MEILEDFSTWLSVNYGKKFYLSKLCKKGVGVHNGSLHRSLSQIQIKLFELDCGLNTIISTSSIIEGVNTQAEQVIVWSNKNGSRRFDYFTYRNIVGRAGRMFKYFVGKVYLLADPPKKEDISLKIDCGDDFINTLDLSNLSIEINNEQKAKLEEYEIFLKNNLGEDGFNALRKLPEFKICKYKVIRNLIEKMCADKDWPRDYSSLSTYSPYNWKKPIYDVMTFLKYKYDTIKRINLSILSLSKNWTHSIPEIIKGVPEDCSLTYDNLFSTERFISFNLCSIFSIINTLKKYLDHDAPDISIFLQKTSNVFLPKLVYQLEEYGLPRMISRKIQNSNIINLEDDSKELFDVLNEFKAFGCDNLIDNIQDVLPFDRFIIKYFYDGIS